MKLLVVTILTLGCSMAAFGSVQRVPEIDGASAASAIALISGGILLVRGRRK